MALRNIATNGFKSHIQLSSAFKKYQILRTTRFSMKVPTFSLLVFLFGLLFLFGWQVFKLRNPASPIYFSKRSVQVHTLLSTRVCMFPFPSTSHIKPTPGLVYTVTPLRIRDSEGASASILLPFAEPYFSKKPLRTVNTSTDVCRTACRAFWLLFGLVLFVFPRSLVAKFPCHLFTMARREDGFSSPLCKPSGQAANRGEQPNSSTSSPAPTPSPAPPESFYLYSRGPLCVKAVPYLSVRRRSA